MDIKLYLKQKKEMVDGVLENYLVESCKCPDNLRRSMQHSLMAGGKRLRPLLAIAAAEAVSGDPKKVMPLACALEMIHTFSLIHDDLPAMDDDDLRRGVPTNHKVFGEAMAILAGDALISEAFFCLSGAASSVEVPLERLIEVIKDVAEATGPRGMVGGQVIDMESEDRQLGVAELEQLHHYKTGQLLIVSVVGGAKMVGASNAQLTALRRYGEAIGLAFQIADDILDIEGTTEEIGKPVGSDVDNKKATFPKIIGMKESKKRAAELIELAVEALREFDSAADPLRAIAKYIIERRN